MFMAPSLYLLYFLNVLSNCTYQKYNEEYKLTVSADSTFWLYLPTVLFDIIYLLYLKTVLIDWLYLL